MNYLFVQSFFVQVHNCYVAKISLHLRVGVFDGHLHNQASQGYRRYISVSCDEFDGKVVHFRVDHELHFLGVGDGLLLSWRIKIA